MYGCAVVTSLAVAALSALCWGDSRIQRLPRTVWPTQYTLSVLTDLHGTNFTGNVTIDVEVREATRNITLHAKGLILGPSTILKKDSNSSIDISGQEMKGPLVTFLVSSSLQPGDRVTLRIPFSGRLNPSRQRGYYRIKTGNLDTDWMSGTVFEFNHAREAFPCFDEPEFKSQFRISLVHHQNHTALSNMPVVSSQSFGNEGDWVVDQFDNTPIISSYLVAYHLLKSGFRETQTEDGRPLRVWASTKQLRWVNNSLDLAPRALSHLEKLTGLPDPLPKQDLVAVPRFQGALENWGVLSFMPSGLIYRPGKEGSMLQRVLGTKLVTHELSHTWFGNLVTPQWWDSLWLSEGAATFFTSLIMDQMEPEWEQFNSDTEEHLSTTFFSNAVSSPGYALNHPVEWAKDLRTVSSAPYFKGFSLIRMLYFTLGKEKFQEGIQRYLTELQYKTTTPQLFYQAMQYSFEGQELPELMDSWTYRSGLPIVFVNRSEGQLILSQERFYMALYKSEEKPKTVEKTKWWIPISYTTNSEKGSGDPKPKFWFNDENKTLEDPAKPEDWLLLNVQAAGTYHVRYDKANLELIKNALRNSSLEDIPPLNRFQLVLDYGMFGLAGLEPLDEVLDLMDYLGREQHFAPWAAGIRIFWRMDQRLRNTQAGFRLKDRVRELLAPEFERVGVRNHKNDSVPLVRHRIQIVQQACLYQLPDCVLRAGRFFQKWMEQQQPDKINPIPQDLRFSVYCTGLRFHGIKHFQFLQERALTSRDPVNRDIMFTALGCSDKYHLLYGFMETYLANSTTTKRDFTKLLQGLVQYNNDISPVLDFMESSMVKLKSVSKRKLRWNQTMLKDLSQQIFTQQQLNQLKNMMTLSRGLTPADLDGMEQTVEHNYKWREKYKNM